MEWKAVKRYGQKKNAFKKSSMISTFGVDLSYLTMLNKILIHLYLNQQEMSHVIKFFRKKTVPKNFGTIKNNKILFRILKISKCEWQKP